MPIFLLVLCLLIGAGAAAQGAPAVPFEAFQSVPRPQAELIAIIDGKGGAPLPEEWTFVVHDPQGANGVREYVIDGAEVISQRAVSQLAPSLTAADALGIENIKVFPPQLAELAQRFAETNELALGSLDYQLRKDGSNGTPVWTVACRNEAGAPLGALVVSAATGQIVSHEGFANAPADTTLQALAEEDSEFLESDEARSSQRPTKKRTKKTSKSSSTKGNPISRSLRKVGATLHKFFTGR